MRLIRIQYQIQYGGVDEWHLEDANVVAASDTGLAIEEFKKFTMDRTIAPDPGETSEPITVTGFRLIEAKILVEQIDFISPTALLQQGLRLGLIEAADASEPADHDIIDTEDTPA